MGRPDVMGVMPSIPIERQERNVRRDGALVFLGLVGLFALEASITSESIVLDGGLVYGFLYGGSVGVLISGIFRVPDKRVPLTALAFGAGFAFGAVVDVF